MFTYLVSTNRRKTKDLPWLPFSLLGHSAKRTKKEKYYGDKMNRSERRFQRIRKPKIRYKEAGNDDFEHCQHMLTQAIHLNTCINCDSSLGSEYADDGITWFCPKCSTMIFSTYDGMGEELSRHIKFARQLELNQMRLPAGMSRGEVIKITQTIIQNCLVIMDNIAAAGPGENIDDESGEQ